MKTIKYFLLISFIFSTIFFPVQAVFAEEAENIASENPLCWTKKACEEKRKELLGNSQGSYQGGWVQEYPCTDDFGKCLPVGVTKTQISFGGSDEFREAGSYIRTVYNYGIAVIGIVAVVVIIIAGAQWITSAGNAEVIGRAKKRISGALIGLFIAYMSYAILQTINPATVSLRLPQVWLVAPIEERGVEVTEGGYCDPYGTNETKTACEVSGDKICFTIGYDSEREGPCAKAAYWISVGSVSMLGAASGVGGALGNGASRLVSGASSRIVPAITRIPASELAKYSTTEIAKSTLKNAGSKLLSLKALKWGGTVVAAGMACDKLSDATADSVSCGKIAVSTAEGMVNLAVEEFKDFFANHNGICLPKAEALRNGDMCKVGASQCAEGKCVKMAGVTAVFKCWANTEIGFCSDGSNGAQCYNDADCKAGLKCVEDAYVPLCSDGRAGSPCGKPEDCQSKLCNKDRCVGSVLPDGSWCSDTAECKSTSQCIAIQDCGPNYVNLVPGVCETQCQAWDLSANKVWEGKWGVCIPVKQENKINLVKIKMQQDGSAPASGDALCPGY